MDNAAAVDISMTPAPGNTKNEVVGIIRSSSGNFSTQNSETKPIPNYLRVRPSTGSCHDFCKYGMRRHDVETKNKIYRRPAKTEKSIIHDRLANKDAGRKVSAYTKSVAVSTKHTGDSRLKLPRTQTPGSTNRQNGGNKPNIPKFSRKTGMPSTASPSKGPSVKSRNINIPRKVSKLEKKESGTKKTVADYENVPEKTLYVIDESRSDNQKTDSRAEKSSGNGDVDVDGSARKLEFKKGERLEIPSETDNCRVLKFRQAKPLKEIQNDGCSNGTDDNSSRVVLRPQTVGKKESSPGLYNSMIKETARKLGQTRKSKVKALVGAFETVITLQDKKTSRTFRS